MKNPGLIIMGSRLGGGKQITPVDGPATSSSIFPSAAPCRPRGASIRPSDHRPPAVPEGRAKPRGAAHAALCALLQVEGPFAGINADDFCGRRPLPENPGDESGHAMVGRRIENTPTENGSVSRGLRRRDRKGYLTDIEKRRYGMTCRGDIGAVRRAIADMKADGNIPKSCGND